MVWIPGQGFVSMRPKSMDGKSKGVVASGSMEIRNRIKGRIDELR